MDYVQEELARQRLALARLMMGGTTKDFTEDMETGVNTFLSPEKRRVRRELDAGAEDRGSRLAWNGETGSGYLDGLKNEMDAERLASLGKEFDGEWTALRRNPEGGGEGLAEFPAEQVDMAAPKRFGEWQTGDGRTGMASTGDPAERTGKERHTLRDVKARERMVTEVLWVGPERQLTAGADELSRTFQRDARRYDGGFSLY